MQNLFFKFTICQTFLLWEGHLKFKSSIMVGHLNLNRSILKSSNAHGLPGKSGVLKCWNDWCIRRSICFSQVTPPPPPLGNTTIIKCSGQEHRANSHLKENSMASFFFSLFNYLRVKLLSFTEVCSDFCFSNHLRLTSNLAKL